MLSKKVFFSILSLLSISVFFAACTKPDITFGTSYIDNSFTNIVTVDTATPVLSTVFIDSFQSSNSGKGLLGNYTDPYFGNISAESYFPIVPPSFQDIYTNSQYDSLELIIKPNKTYYGDTTLPLKINVNQLNDKIAYAENKAALYNINSVATNPTPLGTKTMFLRPSVTDTISIRLSDEKGIELLNKLKTVDNVIKTSDQFLEYFKGLRISGGSSAFMIGYSDSIIMRLHYRDPGVIQQSKSVDFTIGDASLQFNQVSLNRTGTVLSNLNATNREITSDATNNESFMQPASGSVIKIRFPYLRNFLQINQFIKIVRAELLIKPMKNSFSGMYPLPPQIRLTQTSLSNDFESDITQTISGSAVTEYGDLYIDDLYGENTVYSYDVTSYITAQMAISTNNSNGLLLSPPASIYGTTFNRLVLGDKNSAKPGVQLKLYYLTVAK